MELHGTRIVACPAEGPEVGVRGAMDLIGEALGSGAPVVMIPVERLTEDFFRLRTGIAGEIVQKFVNYRVRLAVVGDISRFLKASPPLRDFVYEANRGDHVWFVE